MNRKYIFTGGPGFGKSSVIDEFEKKGVACIPEAPRQVMLEQQRLTDGILPQNDFEGFAKLVLERMVQQYEDAPSGLAIFDRAIPDIAAYLRYADLDVPNEVTKIMVNHPYHPTVFFFPAWEEIFDTDGVRYETFQEAKAIGESLKDVYTSLDYAIHEVPKLSVPERVNFVRQHLPLKNRQA